MVAGVEAPDPWTVDPSGASGAGPTPPPPSEPGGPGGEAPAPAYPVAPTTAELPLPPPVPNEPAVPLGPAPGPTASLVGLFVSLVGLLLVALILYESKFHGVTVTYHGFPTRVLFSFALILTAAPFLVTIFRRVPIPYLVAPIGVIMFLYPIFSPFGLPFSRDPTYNFQFSQAILNTGSWAPLVGVTGQAGVYSYYPGGAVFNAEVASLTGLAQLSTFNWAYELLRFLVIPLAIYALAARLFGARSAPLAVLFYVSIPSIELNVPTQQDFATVWFVLAMVVLAYLATSRGETGSTFLRAMVVVAALMAIISHHVTTYLLIGFLLGFAVLPWILKRRELYPNARPFLVLGGTIAMALVWVVVVTYPVIRQQGGILSANLAALLHPATASLTAGSPGHTFPLYDIVWIAAAIVILGGLAVLTLVETYPVDNLGFITFGTLSALLVGVLAIPFVSTGFSFLALRQLEFSGVFLAPAAAWWVTNRFVRPKPRPTIPAAAGSPLVPLRVRPARPRGPAVAGLAGVLGRVVSGGGFLVPLSTRDQFASVPSGVLVDSPMFVNESAYAAAMWADAHLNHDRALWGDYYTYTALGGFGQFRTVWDAYPLFENASFNQTILLRLHVGDYVVVDAHMTTLFARPMFYGPLTDQPTTPIPSANLVKFTDDQYFALLFENSAFTIYEVAALPPA